MYPTDQDAFRAILDRSAAVFGKELTNELRTGYWEALRDQPLQSVKELSARHERYGKFFPKPFELRPKDDKPRGREDPPWRSEMDRRAILHLEELRRENPTRWLEVVRPRCYEIGHLKGMTDAQIEAKLQRAVEAG